MTATWATSTGSGPSLRRVSSIVPGRSTVRSTATSSTGGPVRSPSPGPPSRAKPPIATAIRASGIAPSAQAGRPPPGAALGSRPRLHQALPATAPGQLAVGGRGGGRGQPRGVADAEEPGPAELGELADVGVEHVVAVEGELELEDAALALALDHVSVYSLGFSEVPVG